MKSYLRKLLLCAVALPFLILGTAAQAAMTDAEIKAAVSGKSFKYSGPATGTVGYRTNGVKNITYTYKGKVKSKTGTWWVKGNKICSKQTRKGSKGKKVVQCQTLTSLGGGKIKSSNGYTLTPK